MNGSNAKAVAEKKEMSKALRLRIGKAAEHAILAELFKHNFSIYTPLADTDGTDAILRHKNGAYLEVQVKSRNITHPTHYYTIAPLHPRYNYFVILYNITTNDYFVIPSLTYKKHCIIKRIKGRTYHTLMQHYLDTVLVRYKNEEGLDMLKKAILHKNNKLK